MHSTLLSIRAFSGMITLGACAAALALLLLGAAATDPPGRVYDSPDAVEPLTPGSPVPSARLRTAKGEPIDLAEALRDRGALLVFYRGGW